MLGDQLSARGRNGGAIAAFALTEPEAGSDAGAQSTTATRDGGRLPAQRQQGFISNATIDSYFVVLARIG